jgi:hypothetical protein
MSILNNSNKNLEEFLNEGLAKLGKRAINKVKGVGTFTKDLFGRKKELAAYEKEREQLLKNVDSAFNDYDEIKNRGSRYQYADQKNAAARKVDKESRAQETAEDANRALKDRVKRSRQIVKTAVVGGAPVAALAGLHGYQAHKENKRNKMTKGQKIKSDIKEYIDELKSDIQNY